MTEKSTLNQSKLTGATEIVFCFDTTGSMSSCIADVRRQVRELVVEMSKDIPDLKIGIIAHGDYCDGPHCIKTLDLTDDHDAIIEFINSAPDTGGGDADECYELALHEAKKFSWSKNGKGAFVIIGDAYPHTPEYESNTKNLDWLEELQELSEKAKVYAMQCLRYEDNSHDNSFWEKVAEVGGTELLILENFSQSGDTLGAVAYATSGSKAAFYSYRSRRSEIMCDTSVTRNFDNLAASMDDEDGE